MIEIFVACSPHKGRVGGRGRTWVRRESGCEGVHCEKEEGGDALSPFLEGRVGDGCFFGGAGGVEAVFFCFVWK